MSRQHLSDDEIQDYLDGNNSKNIAEIKSHLQSCEICENKLFLYKNIYTELTKDTDFTLSPQFPQQMASIAQKESPGIFGIRISDTVLSIVLLVLGIGGALLLVDYRAIGNVFTSLNLPKLNFITTIYFSLKSILINSNMNISLVAFAIIILLFIFALDRFILHSKIKYTSS